MPPTREWTVMFYLASDNPLAPGTVPHLKAMKSAGYHPEVNVIAQFDPHTENIPVHIFDVNRMEKLQNPNKVNIGFGANDSFVRNLLADKLWSSKINKRIKTAMKPTLSFKSFVPPDRMSHDRDPKESLRDFLNFCQSRYPARHYILFVIGHGLAVGDDLFLFDEHGARKNGNSGPRSLLLKDLGKILSEFKEKVGDKGELELIGFHSCSMSGAEVAFELKGAANYMLASQGTAYLHSWPYRQLLIRLFNDLGSSPFSKDDLRTNDLVNQVMTGDDQTSEYIRGLLGRNGGAKLLAEHDVNEAPSPKLIEAVASEISDALGNSRLFKVPELQRIRQSTELQPLITKHQKQGINGQYLRFINARFLLDGLPARVRKASTKTNIRNLMISIFQHCLYNTYDFHLAGYPSDLTLCDLNKVGKLRESVANLVKTLKAALESAEANEDPLVADLLVMAHWDAQSFYEERYTDLYDFCFRLSARCRRAEQTTETSIDLDAISKACVGVMTALKRGVPGSDDGIIVRSEFCGAESQYTHGLSVFFPWSRPTGDVLWDEQYKTFKFARTGWAGFLNAYFKGTMRKPQHEEADPLDNSALPETLDRSLLGLVETLNTEIFPGIDELKSGSRDPLGPGKSGSRDPTGSDCQCGSIKNYPPVSRPRITNNLVSRQVANIATSHPRFIRELKKL